ncbi:MAG TPA: TetR family transcriptional regulator [Solirubrobacteraceae bacterium]|nr:TetR family transcriptional regulator [Solirubrobacteraceae bacterium]
MTPTDRTLRSDAERNRRRLLNAAQALFRERGLDVGVAEIAQRAGVGRGTLFRNFPTKQDLIAAIVIDRMHEATAHAQTLLDAPDPGDALFGFLEEIVGPAQLDSRALFDAMGDTFLANQGIRAAHAEIVAAIEQLLTRAKEAGAVRTDVGAMDVLMLVKGACEASAAFASSEPGIVTRQLDLVRAAVSASAADRPLRGRPPTLADIERAFPQPDVAAADAG